MRGRRRVKHPIPFLLIYWIALVALFAFGQVLGSAFSNKEEEATSTPEPDELAPLSAIILGNHSRGQSIDGEVAAREGFSQTAQGLLSLYDNTMFGGEEFARALMSLDFAAVERLVEECEARRPLTPKMQQLHSVVRRRLAEMDPERVLAGGWDYYAFELFAKSDPHAALEHAVSLEDESQRRSALAAALQALRRLDPEAAAAEIARLDVFSHPGFSNTYLGSNLAHDLMKRDPGAAAKFVEEMPHSKSREHALKSLAKHWATEDPAAASAWLDGLESFQEEPLRAAKEELIRVVTEKHPEFALEFVNTVEDRQLRTSALGRLSGSYAKRDPDSALEWLGGLDGYDDVSTAAHGVVGGLEPGDLGRYEQVFELMPPGGRKRLVDHYARRWASSNPDAAIEWAHSLPVRERFSAVEGISGALCHDEGGSKHVEIARLIDSDPNIARTFTPYHARSWAIVDSVAAFDWASKMPEPVTRRTALGEVLERWGRQDPVAARKAIEESPGLDAGDRAAMEKLLPKPAAPAEGG